MSAPPTTQGEPIEGRRQLVEYLAAGQTKVETFTVKSVDGTTQDVEVTITGVNDAPEATGDTGGTDEDTAFTTANVLDNDTDAEGQTLSVLSIDTSGTTGLVVDNGDGT